MRADHNDAHRRAGMTQETKPAAAKLYGTYQYVPVPVPVPLVVRTVECMQFVRYRTYCTDCTTLVLVHTTVVACCERRREPQMRGSRGQQTRQAGRSDNNFDFDIFVYVHGRNSVGKQCRQ